MAGSVALNLLAYRHAYAMMHFSSKNARTQKPENLNLMQRFRVLSSGVSLPRPKTSAAPSDLSSTTRSLFLDGTNGIKLGAWHCPGSDEKNLVILFHGYGGEKSGTMHEARVFLEMGMSVMLIDFRGSGDSSGSDTTIGFREAEDVAFAMLCARGHFPNRKVILYGQSMGAAAILRAVHSLGVSPDAIILEAVFDELSNTVRHRFEAMGVPSFPSAELLLFWGGHQAGFDGFAHNPVRYAASVKCPALFLHGSDDPRARIAESRRVFAAVSAQKVFKEFSGVGHQASAIRFPKEWKETVDQFISKLNAPIVRHD